MPRLKVLGLASAKTILELDVSKDDLDQNLLEYLRSKQIPIASSCNGEGVCKKCIVNKNVISCENKLQDILENNIILIEISYL